MCQPRSKSAAVTLCTGRMHVSLHAPSAHRWGCCLSFCVVEGCIAVGLLPSHPVAASCCWLVPRADRGCRSGTVSVASCALRCFGVHVEMCGFTMSACFPWWFGYFLSVCLSVMSVFPAWLSLPSGREERVPALVHSVECARVWACL